MPLAGLDPLLSLVTPAPAAPWPCWHGSTTKPVKFQPMTRREAIALYDRADRFETATRPPGRQDGAITRNGLRVLWTLLFRFHNYRTGRLDPSHQGIALKGGLAERSVRRGLAALKAAGVVNWLRRCKEVWTKGRFQLHQERNAYAVLPASQWHGFEAACPRDRSDRAPPLPLAGTWGDHPPLPQPVEAAGEVIRAGGPLTAILRELQADPADKLAMALARLGSGFLPPQLL